MTPQAVAAQARRDATRKAILATAVRLFAEQGVLAVSNRQIGSAAGRGNTSVVGYYFDSKADLVRELVRGFNARVEQNREQRFLRMGRSPDVRDWIGCLVHPYAELLNADGPNTWFARFMAQVVADPGLRRIAVEEAGSDSVARISAGLRECLPGLTEHAVRDRSRISTHVIVQMCAERERALAEGTPVTPPTWEEAATSLVDVLVGMWTAEVTPAEDGDDS
ncbi:TetR family transcriptional regulator [Saccharopolyspora sp. HNM0983]|uniref:TetR family transcriptional regulator n=1 Tax=Saccharopolyspora montiporae TaxID=2781240 RepID=A0A929B6S1_9PSEU|nr:TetR family transcriptional regulator [Saccharopolyspora sp. HNM0983]